MLGASVVDTSLPRQSDSHLRNSFLDPPLLGRQCSRDSDLRNGLLEPSAAIAKQRSRSDEILGDEPAYHTPPFEDCQNNITSPKATQVIKHHSSGNIFQGSPSSAAEGSRNKSPLSRSLESLDSSLH
uniref:Uncharacterized protein n=2 Tax=Noccaea caerulescens TaxID=107243 RepID=A0A1J3I0Z8_NOCCA